VSGRESDYYRLRFQLEFNFRDAKQYWGLEDLMNVNPRPVYNGANLAMFMVNVSHALMRPMRAQCSAFSVNDLKAWFRGQKYVVETLKLPGCNGFCGWSEVGLNTAPDCEMLGLTHQPHLRTSRQV
jgi:hypothetical protein